MITNKTIKLVLDVEQFGISSDLIFPTTSYTVSVIHSKCFFFFTFLLRHSMYATEIPFSTLQPVIHIKI